MEEKFEVDSRGDAEGLEHSEGEDLFFFVELIDLFGQDFVLLTVVENINGILLVVFILPLTK